MRRLIERPLLTEKSQVALAKAEDYSKAFEAVKNVVDLLGGAKKFCGPGDVVMIKPNLIYATKSEEAETTNPAVVEAVVKLFKETGATVKVGEQTGWHCDPELAYDVTGIKDAAFRGGADEVCNWDTEEYVDVKVPNPRHFGIV